MSKLQNYVIAKHKKDCDGGKRYIIAYPGKLFYTTGGTVLYREDSEEWQSEFFTSWLQDCKLMLVGGECDNTCDYCDRDEVLKLFRINRYFKKVAKKVKDLEYKNYFKNSNIMNTVNL